MTWQNVLIGLFVWLGGIIAWALAALFEFLGDHGRFERRREFFRGAAEQNSEFLQPDEDIDEKVESDGVPRANMMRSLIRTGVQPLLVLSFLVFLSPKPWSGFANIVLDVGVIGAFVMVFMTIMHELYSKERFHDRWWYITIVFSLWVGYAALLIWTASVALEKSN
jgi:hypothetical protein